MNVVPQPHSVRTPSTGALVLDDSARIVATSPDARSVALWLQDALHRDTRVRLSLEPAPAPGARGSRPAVHLRLDDALEHGQAPAEGIAPDGTGPDERYTLRITRDEAVLTARTPAGLMRAAATLRQLAFDGTRDGSVELAETEIADGPKYAWRGLSLDIARYFLTPEKLRATVDLLATLKLNVLHLHLTDNEGWRIEIPTLPELTPEGSEFLTMDDFRELIAYAAERHVTVIPEVGMPAHIGAAARACPDIATTANADAPAIPGIPDGMSSYIDPDNQEGRRFVREVLTAVAENSPAPFLHIGGDEAMSMPLDAYRRFIAFAAEEVERLDKRMIGWQEASRAGLPSSALAQFWHDTDVRSEIDEVKAGLAAGHPLLEIVDFLETSGLTERFVEDSRKSAGDLDLIRRADVPVILSPKSATYLDRRYATADGTSVPDRPHLGHPFYPARSLEDAWGWDPAATADGVPIAGIEAALWSESVRGFDDLGWLLLPRLAQVAEHAWGAERTPWPDQQRRLAARRPHWQHLGWTVYNPTEPAPARPTPAAPPEAAA